MRPQIDRHIKDLAVNGTHQLALGKGWQLVVQTTQDMAHATRVVVLHEMYVKSGRFVEGLLVEALEEEAARIAEHFRLDEQHLGNGERRGFHAYTRSRRRPFR